MAAANGSAAGSSKQPSAASAAATSYIQTVSRTSPQTVTWLHDHFEPHDGVSLGRETLYKHYQDQCVVLGQDPVNQASFGKLIRSVFPSLKTRRLGTRGNSKYHYYGIRLRPTSTLEFSADQIGGPSRGTSRRSHPDKPKKLKQEKTTADSDNLSLYLAVKTTLPPFPALPAGIDQQQAAFTQAYHTHCKGVLKSVCKAEFPRIQNQLQQFWGTDALRFMPMLATAEGGQYLTEACDPILYDAISRALIRDVLSPMPENLTKEIRFFAKCLEPWYQTSLAGYPEALVATRVARVRRLAHTLRRYTSLNHLAGAAFPVLAERGQTEQMLTDLTCVDFVAVQAQAQMVCDCDKAVVLGLQEEFKALLASQPSSLNKLAQWLQKVMRNFIGAAPDPKKRAKQFLTRWSFYSSIVIRELTLRSAVSFGSFHLIGLLMDEYLIYLAEEINDKGIEVLARLQAADAAPKPVSASMAVPPPPPDQTASSLAGIKLEQSLLQGSQLPSLPAGMAAAAAAAAALAPLAAAEAVSAPLTVPGVHPSLGTPLPP